MHDYEPKGQNFGCTPLENIPPVDSTEKINLTNTLLTMSIHVLEGTDNAVTPRNKEPWFTAEISVFMSMNEY